MKTLGGDACIIYHILYQYFQTSKIQKQSERQKSTSQADDIILDACMQFEKFPIKTVGKDAFYSYFILYHYFKISKVRQKFKKFDRQKKTQPR